MALAGLLKCQSFKTTLCFSHFSLTFTLHFFFFFLDTLIFIIFPSPPPSLSVWLQKKKQVTYCQLIPKLIPMPKSTLGILPQLKYVGCQGDVMTKESHQRIYSQVLHCSFSGTSGADYSINVSWCFGKANKTAL